MIRTIWDKRGLPVFAFGSQAIYTNKKESAPEATKPEIYTLNVNAGEVQIAPHGDDNNLTQSMNDDINKTPSLRQGLKYKRDLIMGQGIYPAIVKGFDDNGNELLDVVNDDYITGFLQSAVIRNYVAFASRDLLKFGFCLPKMLMNQATGKIVGINVIDARYGRWQVQNEAGGIENLVVCGYFPQFEKESSKVLPVLDSYDPEMDLLTRMAMKKVPSSFIYPLRDSFDNAVYYPLPDWYTAKLAGWLDIAQKIPTFLNAMYTNQASFKYHIQIPYSHWDKKYPITQFVNDEERKAAIQKDLDNLIDNVTDIKNAYKAIATHFDTQEEKIEIKEFSQKWSNEQLMTSAVVNSEIFGAMGINPAVRGLMPGNSVYAGNSGGSNIREAFLIDIALAWAMRQQILDPLELMLKFNGADPKIQLKFKNTFLTTLDTGAGTAKNLS